ncbi:NAD(P)-dependent oxidoreductase [Celerinatantimonas sp. YJH-8]|uniref:NAD(P)-dependent oxidoreductase n=1 Tax=Celerinatantimonas sp. YJH-8 TaxID=3228714 RepID=UPI0038C4C1E1
MTLKSYAFIGLGVMGYPMSGHVATAGYPTRVYNRTPTKMAQWKAIYPGQICTAPSQAAIGSDIVALCVGNDQDVREVVYGRNGVLATMKPGSILIDHTTTSAELAIELNAACQRQQIHFIDAPVSGGQSGAEQGTLTIMCGGEQTIIDAIRPILSCYGQQISYLGTAGQGQRCKMINQICIAGILQGLSEALLLAQKSELDITQVIHTLKLGAAGSWQMENRAQTMTQDSFDFGFAIDWMLKDLNICRHEAQKHQLQLPMTDAVYTRYQSLQAQGLGRMDTSALIKACTLAA